MLWRRTRWKQSQRLAPSPSRFHSGYSIGKYALQIFEAPGGNRLPAFVKVEHLDRNKALVADFLQCGGDGIVINFAEAGPFQIPVVRVEVGEARPRFADDLRDRF